MNEQSLDTWYDGQLTEPHWLGNFIGLSKHPMSFSGKMNKYDCVYVCMIMFSNGKEEDKFNKLRWIKWR